MANSTQYALQLSDLSDPTLYRVNTTFTSIGNRLNLIESKLIPATVSTLGFVRPDGITITITTDGVISATSGGGSVGTVKSVGLSMPAIFTVAGSPITTTGTFTVGLAVESAHAAWLGPPSGGASTPTFRPIIPSDLPVATSSTEGIVQPDNSTVTISGGVISATGGVTSGWTSEVPTGTLNGVNRVFTLGHVPIPHSVTVQVNILQSENIDYSISSTTITFAVAPKATDSGWFYVRYQY